MTDRREQARDEARDILSDMAAEQVPLPSTPFEALKDGFVMGAGWADANPKPHTITRGDFQAICFEIAGQVDPNMRRSEVLATGVLGGLVALGIEVVDDE